MRRVLLPLAAAAVLLPAAGADAAKRPRSVTFDATFEAQRTAEWDQPRVISHTNCQGGHYVEAGGKEDQRVRSSGSFKVHVTGSRRAASFEFGRRMVVDPRDAGVDAKGPHRREWTHRAGSTGGWCGGGEESPKLENDCGTQLPEYKVVFSAGRDVIDWTMSYRNLPRERFGFYRCPLHTPLGLPAQGFPRLQGKVSLADLFDRRKRRVVVEASKSYGPTSQPLGNSGQRLTSSGRVTWKLTLTRAGR
jgi:hypothetical protein